MLHAVCQSVPFAIGVVVIAAPEDRILDGVEDAHVPPSPDP